MALNVPSGTLAKRKATKAPTKNSSTTTKNGGAASVPGGDGKTTKAAKAVTSLNPPFDPRMRTIGSPLNLTSRIKRGWIQDEDTGQRVNFLFNPSQLDLTHSVDPAAVRLDAQAPPDDPGTDPAYFQTTSSTGVKLLYDRTYELFSPPKAGVGGFANKYGVWADVAAWYVFLGMLDAMPTSWENSMITKPGQLKKAYLFVGPKLVFYGWVTGINVTYSHFTQNMVPQRCAVDLGFQILPHTGDAPLTGEAATQVQGLVSWLTDYSLAGLDGAAQ